MRIASSLQGPAHHRAAVPPRATTARSSTQTAATTQYRRDLLVQLAGGAVLWSAAGATPAALAVQQMPEVGTYLPPAGIDDFVLFVPDSKKTPAIRAGTVNPNSPYRVTLPPSFRERQVANIQSGNYCQPRCAEPWTEVVFEGKEGKILVIVSPLVRLTNKKDAPIQEIGPPEGILTSLGSFITGTYLDEEDVVSASSKQQDDGRMYYYYELNAGYGTNGPHTYSAVTTKGDLALLFVAAANDKQWAAASDRLKKAAESFRA